jgi:hypothetical protein
VKRAPKTFIEDGEGTHEALVVVEPRRDWECGGEPRNIRDREFGVLRAEDTGLVSGSLEGERPSVFDVRKRRQGRVGDGCDAHRRFGAQSN